MSTTVTTSSSTACSTTTWIEPKMIIPTKYTKTVSSLPPGSIRTNPGADHRHFYIFFNNKKHVTPRSELFSQPPPSPNTVKVKNEKDSAPEKDSYWLGCFLACFLFCAVKNERG